jgi:tRNA pseudouridine55 synthase
MSETSGILLVNKPTGKVSFSLVAALRKITNVSKIGHAGTLDPFATGLMVMLIGKQYTRMSDSFLTNDKEYITTVHLGIETDTYDPEGVIVSQSDLVPSLEEIKTALATLSGSVYQTPPMFSAKKKDGKKLYELARKGITIDRLPSLVHIEPVILSYEYPYLKLSVKCSKGTYIRSIAYDLGKLLGCGAHLSALHRTRSGNFDVEKAVDGACILDRSVDVTWVEQSLISA